jgi:conjugal transfer pilus assembly protein TraF
MKLYAAALALGLCFSAVAQNTNPSDDLAGGQAPERGWFFFETLPVPEEAAPSPKAEFPSKLPPPPKEEKCKDKATWTPECGFVNPGSDFAFQEKQRDALMQGMSLANNDPKAVEAFQYYMRWVLERTAETTNLWWYNMVQNPELDPNVAAPVSAFGLRLMTDVQKGQEREIFDLVKAEGGFFVYFSRTDCTFCHQMKDVLQALSKRTGLEIRNASLDGSCMPGFEKGCMTSPATDNPARSLQVATVPAIFLYVQPNTWIRVATGVVDVESMTTRTVQFFAAYRSALLTGVENSQDGRPSVDFSNNAPKGTGGVAGESKSGGKIELPSESEISRMLGATQ